MMEKAAVQRRKNLQMTYLHYFQRTVWATSFKFNTIIIGIPIKKYLILHQLEKAFAEILQGVSITKASMDSGFDSPSHFAAVVKSLMGLPAKRGVKDSVFLKVY